MLFGGMNEKHSPLIIGFGSQGKAWAMNLRDSGFNVSFGLRENSRSKSEVEKLGFSWRSLDEALPTHNLILLLIPDHEHLSFFETHHEIISNQARIIYAHGASILQNDLEEKFPQFTHLLLAPKAIASEVRFSFETKKKLGACYYAQNDDDKKLIREIATGIGIGDILISSSFKEETYADLMSEQSVLCSLLPYGALHSFNELINRGVKPEIAYMECWLEVKLIAKAMIDMGPTEFFKLISPNALLGGEKAQKMIFDKAYQTKLKQLCSEIWDGSFFEEVEQADFEKIRAEVELFWKDTELQKIHDQIHDKLN
jgi:ketol-acid reductoisomerase